MARSQEWRVGFIMGGLEVFKVSLHSWQRGANPLPLFYEYPLYYPLPCYLQPPPALFFLFFSMFLWLKEWSCHIWCAILLNDNIDLCMLSLGALVPEGPWCVFYTTRREVYWGLTYNVAFYWYSDLISYTHKHTQHTQRPVDWHTHMNIYLHHLLCACSRYLYYSK